MAIDTGNDKIICNVLFASIKGNAQSLSAHNCFNFVKEQTKTEMVKLEFLIVFLAFFAISVESLKYVSEDLKDFQRVKMQQIIHKALITQKTTELNTEAIAEDSFDTTSFRLPNNTIPLHYDINLRTEIHAANFLYEGVVRIDISVLEASNTVTIHSRGHLFLGIILFNSDGSVFDSSPFYTFNSNLEFLTITSQNQLPVNQNLTVQVTFVGILSQRETDRGWFRSFYPHPETNETVWLAATHHHPINARSSFPCYDEAQHRVPIKLHINHHESYNAVSNMPVESTESGDGYVVTNFETSPPMQIFVLSFLVSDFDFVSTIDDGLEFRVIARPEAIAAGEADNALELGVTFLRAVEEYFGVNYSFPKSDQIANPQLEGDGSSNWGLLSFDQNILLQFNDDPVLQANRERVLGHEYSVSFLKFPVISI